MESVPTPSQFEEKSSESISSINNEDNSSKLKDKIRKIAIHFGYNPEKEKQQDQPQNPGRRKFLKTAAITAGVVGAGVAEASLPGTGAIENAISTITENKQRLEEIEIKDEEKKNFTRTIWGKFRRSKKNRV